MVILDKMILTQRLTEFVTEVLNIRQEEMTDKMRWDVWLHKIFDMDFGEYLAKIDNVAAEEIIPDDSVLEATVKESMGIMNGFCPYEKGADNGAVQTIGNNSNRK